LASDISVVILTKNSSLYIKECLESLKEFSEIIVLDNGSTDETMTIAKKFTNVTIHQHDFIGFGPLKNLAITYASNDWILSIDSDEIVSQELVEEIKNLKRQNNYVYAIARDNFYHHKLVQCCGWKNDYVLRLFNRDSTKFNNKQVHESLLLEDITVHKLQHKMKHYSFSKAENLIDKMQKYSSLYAQEHRGKKTSSPFKAFSRALFSFIKNYFLQKGFLCGYEGFIISVSNANGVFYKYIKLYEVNKHDV